MLTTETHITKPMVPMEIRDSEGVPFASSLNIESPKSVML